MTVVDGYTVLHDLGSRDRLVWRKELSASPSDKRSVACLLVDQIEFSDVLVINKVLVALILLVKEGGYVFCLFVPFVFVVCV